MAYNTMYFSRSSSGYNAEDGDYLDFTPDSSLSFGSLYKCTDFYLSITGGITSATTSARTHEMNLQIEIGGAYWITIWSGSQYLPAKGTTGYTFNISGTIPSSYQAAVAQGGITDIRLQQSGSYALRGATASGSIQVTYVDNVTNCGAPTSVKVNNSASAISTTKSAVNLSWSGASGGTNNSITGYYLFYTNSTDGTNWDGWHEYGGISLEASSGSYDVNIGDEGTYRKFGIATLGSAGEEYGSSIAESPAVYRQSITACGAPTSFSVSSTLATDSVTLSWSGASGGTGNTLIGYLIQRCESSDGSTWGSWSDISTVSSSSVSGSISVNPPSTAGNYYKYRIRTLGLAGEPYFSSWKESTNTLRRDWTACGAPTACSLSATLSTGNVTLSWSGASNGFGNTITGYEVQRCESANGSSWGSWSALSTTTSTSLSVAPHTTAGRYFKYRVRAQGSAGASYYSSWKESTNTLRRNHDPFKAWTDSNLVAGETLVKAVHMTEIHDCVNILLAFNNKNTIQFDTITSGETLIKDWSSHIQKIRSALDSICSGISWISISVNQPRVDVINQIRSIINSM